MVEILVSVAVLALLTVVVANIVQSGNLVISGSRKRLSADAQAREVFSRFSLDLSRMPKRADLDVLVSPANDAIFFYSEAPGFQAAANISGHNVNVLSLVGYRVNANAQLERLGKGLSWTNPPFLTYVTSTTGTGGPTSTVRAESTIEGAWSSVVGSSPYDGGTDDDYHLLADGVFRFFYCFRKNDGTYSLTLNPAPLTWKLQGASAIILTLAVLDDESRKIISDTTKLASALPDPTRADLEERKLLPAELWQAAVDDVKTYASAAGIPEPAAARVRIYQRTFPLNQP